jgi:chromosomal replication initiator protein
VEAHTLYLTAPSGVRGWTQRRYSGLIREAVGAGSAELTEIRFDDEKSELAEYEVELNPNYIFERFVIYPGNQVAHAAVLAVAEAPSGAYNPLFLHGPPGLGKTHLLAAISNYLHENAPRLRVSYQTAESFTGDLMAALKAGKGDALRKRYRDLDVLLIDDVQFLGGPTGSKAEEEFLEIADALHKAGKQLVMAADRPLRDLPALASRLCERFDGGLDVEIERPDVPSRLLLLRRLVEESGAAVEDPGALPELASRIEANVRQLHGALTRVLAHASLTGRPISSELVAEVTPRGRLRESVASTEEVQRRVAESFGISQADLVGSLEGNSMRARHVAIFLTRNLTDLSLPQIGRLYGRDHLAVLESIRAVEATIAEEPEFATRVKEMDEALSRQASAEH